MATLINLLALACLCIYAHTGILFLFVLSFVHLSLCTLGCLSIIVNKFNSPALKWEGWLPFTISCVIMATVTYFTKESAMGLWYFVVTSFWHIATLGTKNINNVWK